MTFDTIVQHESVTTLLTKINKLSLIPLTLKCSLPLLLCGRGHLCGPESFFQQSSFNAPLKRLVPRQLQILNPPPIILPWRCQLWSIYANFIPAERFNNTIPVSPVVLEDDFHLRENAYLTFPFEVNNFIIREAIGRFQGNIKNTVKHMDYVYCVVVNLLMT